MSGKVKKDDFAQYLEEARSWETDKVKAEAKSRKVAWRVATGACVVAALAVTSTMLMAIKPPPPPTVLRVNDSNGMVDVLSTLKDGKTTYNETVNKYFVQWYVRYREGYSKELAEDYYYNVGLMSVSQEQQRYFGAFNPKNPQSPLNVYGDYAKVKVVIKSTSFIQPNVALVRYSKEVTRGNDSPLVTNWAATVTFRYSPLPMSEKDRAINPLGFQVTEYRNDADTLVTEQRSPALAAPSATPAAGVTLFPGQGPSAAASVPAPAVPAVQPGQ
ncbi:conjugal transfer protein [Burkholderia diffusa]|uniref:virB8 family protein n=1 Tax=Burkholderia diffusa TaxID=488732 RepID=UPI00075AF6BE|nr:virB8 family protein [Burkholderia diffusa]KWF77587.1 conjugal transfer protein [Burkholderia diffusa]